MMDHIDQIVAKLTKAQRRSIAAAKPYSNGERVGFRVEFAGDPWPEGVARFGSLVADFLTPLGLSVKARLEEQDD